MKKYKWGILAPGKMSAKFANGLKVLPNAELYAVGSRSIERARKFALDHGFKKSYGTYEELAADPEVDVIYIASPHSFHFEHTMLCLRNGKAVICEKAFGINSREVETMINEAEKRGIFLMEALWPPFQPFYKKASEILESGILGEVKHLHGYFSFIPPFDPADRKFNVSLGGGSLLDIGIYPVIDALTFLGIPDDIRAVALFSETGSEESVSAVFRYNNRCLASVYSSFSTNVGIGCDILCRNGNMTVSRGRDMNQRVILSLQGREKQEYVFTPEALGYHWEAEEVMKCLNENKLESSIVPHAFSINLIRTLDRIRQSAGIHFPQDN
ncbi:MAG: Gfo/Idh/MocA family oxidoreductase [Bacteroidales bacterium]|nr:Gfo/Idh/MocA family oxidoreductase [Bacteroidales bacterium]